MGLIELEGAATYVVVGLTRGKRGMRVGSRRVGRQAAPGVERARAVSRWTLM